MVRVHDFVDSFVGGCHGTVLEANYLLLLSLDHTQYPEKYETGGESTTKFYRKNGRRTRYRSVTRKYHSRYGKKTISPPYGFSPMPSTEGTHLANIHYLKF